MDIVDALALKSLKGVGDASIVKLIEFASKQGIGSLEELTALGLQKLPLRKVPSLEDFLLAAEFQVVRVQVNDQLKAWLDQGITVIHIGSDKYPKQLMDLADPPPFLFCKGNISLLEDTRAIAVVGTRKNSSKGALITAKTVDEFHKRKFVIVSGLALGIDAIAHKAALTFGAPTIAVLVDVQKISPTTNKGLSDEILEKNGLLIAENKPGTPMIGAHFAKRDRIQAGLSTAVFAIETSKNGGTMFAVKAANQMGRPVFVPDPKAAKYDDLTLEVIQGTQYLIETKEAEPYTSFLYDEIVEKLETISQQLNSNSSSKGQKGLLL